MKFLFVFEKKTRVKLSRDIEVNDAWDTGTKNFLSLS